MLDRDGREDLFNVPSELRVSSQLLAVNIEFAILQVPSKVDITAKRNKETKKQNE